MVHFLFYGGIEQWAVSPHVILEPVTFVEVVEGCFINFEHGLGGGGRFGYRARHGGSHHDRCVVKVRIESEVNAMF